MEKEIGGRTYGKRIRMMEQTYRAVMAGKKVLVRTRDHGDMAISLVGEVIPPKEQVTFVAVDEAEDINWAIDFAFKPKEPSLSNRQFIESRRRYIKELPGAR